MNLYDIVAHLINRVLSASERDELLAALEQARQQEQASQQTTKGSSKTDGASKQ